METVVPVVARVVALHGNEAVARVACAFNDVIAMFLTQGINQ